MIRQLTAIDKVEIGREKSMPEWITRYWVEWLFGIVAALAAARISATRMMPSCVRRSMARCRLPSL